MCVCVRVYSLTYSLYLELLLLPRSNHIQPFCSVCTLLRSLFFSHTHTCLSSPLALSHSPSASHRAGKKLCRGSYLLLYFPHLHNLNICFVLCSNIIYKLKCKIYAHSITHNRFARFHSHFVCYCNELWKYAKWEISLRFRTLSLYSDRKTANRVKRIEPSPSLLDRARVVYIHHFVR